MFFYKCKLLRVYDLSLPIRVYLISTSLLKLTSLTALLTIALNGCWLVMCLCVMPLAFLSHHLHKNVTFILYLAP